MSRQSDWFPWVTDIVATENAVTRRHDILTSHSYRPIQHKTFLGRSTRYIEKLQKDRERDEHLHNRSMKNIPRQLRSPTKEKFFSFQEPVGFTKQIYSQGNNSVIRNSLYLRHGHIPSIYSKNNYRKSYIDKYKVEPLSVDQKLIVNSLKTEDSISTSFQRCKNNQVVKTSGVVIHDRPAHRSKTLQRLHFVNPILITHRVENDIERGCDFESMSAINSVMEYNDPKVESVTPEHVLTMRDVFSVKPT